MKPLFTFSSNSIRLSWRNWILALVILLLVFSLLPVLWRILESFDPSDDYRIPYEMSSDYWMYSRWCKYAGSHYQILVIGDSVVWGQYVAMQETLPYYLNEFINNGLKSPLIPLSKGGNLTLPLEKTLVPTPPLEKTSVLAPPLEKTSVLAPPLEKTSVLAPPLEKGGRGDLKGNIFANLGMDGVHPAAILGLVKYYGKSISNKGVILHLNPLWMSSKKHDLSDTEEFRFNHPRLVSQFLPRVPSHKAKFAQRLGTAIERNSFSSWVSHIRLNYYENMDIGNWAMQYPYRNPLSAITFQIPLPENKPHSDPINWMERGMTKQDFPWVSADESFQWDSFKKTIVLLQARKNKVFVVIGPFNPYILTDESLNRYNALKNDIENWFKDNGISYTSISDLPSEYYADASHPLKEGYIKIAKELIESELFDKWMKETISFRNQ